MISQSIIPKCLLPLNAVCLGRFILNTQFPNQDFIDPPSSPPNPDQITTHSLENWKEILTSSRAIQLRNRLTSLLKFSFSNASNNHATLSALKATTYTLQNSREWFNNAIAAPETRRWLESAIEDGAQGVYLIIGYHTLSDTRYQKVVKSGNDFGSDSSIPIGSVVPGADGGANLTSPGGLDLTASMSFGTQTGQSQECGFEIPGEQIYAVQYRKLKFKWYSSKSLKNAVLEQSNRWKVYWEVRGDDEQEDDVLELIFADEFGENVDEDGSGVDHESAEEEEEEEEEEKETYLMEGGGVEYVF